MKWKPYKLYRSSSTFAERAPSHWIKLRLKNILAFNITDGPHATPEFLSDGIPFISVDGIQDGELVFTNCRFISQEDHNAFKKKAFPMHGDILMGKAASTGKIARVKVEFEFSIWSPLALIKINQQRVNSHFVEYLLKSPEVQAQIDNLCTHNTQKNISMDDIPLLQFEVPPILEQYSIATFLDRETERVNKLITLKERQIELLQEKRSAVISHAVTKGLNPTVKMKDSGVERLGRIPEHWNVTRLKYVTSINDESLPESTAPDYEINYVDISGVNINEGITQTETYFFKDSPSRARRIVRDGDTIISTVRTYLKAIAPIRKPDEKLIVSTGFAVLRPTKLNQDFLTYLLNSSYFISEVVSRSVGVGYPAINSTELANIFLPLPDTYEQGVIASYLQEKTNRINDVNIQLNNSIEKLQEYRTALISAAVTGKIDVRQEAA